MGGQWTAETLLELVRGYQPACVLIAAAELDVFTSSTRTPPVRLRFSTCRR